jgi:dUTP pyrophosphatase
VVRCKCRECLKQHGGGGGLPISAAPAYLHMTTSREARMQNPLNPDRLPIVGVIRLPHGEDLDLPQYQSAEAAGMDLIAALDVPLELAPGARALVPTGIIIELPEDHEGQVRPRSGLALKHGVTVLNAPGTIDADYRGEVKVLLVNLSQETFTIARGMRIAQLVIAPFVQARVEVRLQATPSNRGPGGFGSTGS